MNVIKARIRNGRIETDVPVSLPEGTELLVFRADDATEAEKEWDNSPEGIRDWLTWYDSLQPLLLTAEEQRTWDEDKAARKRWEIAHADEREEKLRGLWE